MNFSGTSRLIHQQYTIPSTVLLEAASDKAAGLLHRAYTCVSSGRPIDIEISVVKRAISVAQQRWNHFSSFGHMVRHLEGMTALCGIVHHAQGIPHDLWRCMPMREKHEEATKMAAERIFRTLVLHARAYTHTLPEAGHTLNAAPGRPSASLPEDHSENLINLFNRLTTCAQCVRDNTQTYEIFSATNLLARCAAQQAAALALKSEHSTLACPFLPPANDATSSRFKQLVAAPKLHSVVMVEGELSAYQDDTGKPSGTSLRLTDGPTFHLTAPQSERTGARGKIHIAVAQEGAKSPFIVKLQRHQPAMMGKQEVGDVPLPELLKSTQTAEKAQARIYANLRRAKTRFGERSGALRLFDAQNLYCAPTVHGVDGFGGYYQIMPAMVGDLVDLNQLLSMHFGESVSADMLLLRVRQSIAAQAFVQLDALHRPRGLCDRGMAHLDLKAANITFNAAGIIRLIDFDETQPIRFWGFKRSLPERVGSIASPEREGSPSIGPGRGLGKAYDVWCLASTLLTVGFFHGGEKNGDGAKSSSMLNRGPNILRPRGFTSLEWFVVYDMFWHCNVRSKKVSSINPEHPTFAQKAEMLQRILKVSIAARSASPVAIGAYVTAAYAAFARWLNHRLDLDPILTTLLLRRALAPAPRDRSSARKIAYKLAAHMAGQTDHQRRAVQRCFEEISVAAPLCMAYRELQLSTATNHFQRSDDVSNVAPNGFEMSSEGC